MKNIKENKAITLVALIVTIIILLILAGITISQLKDNGLLGNTKYAVDETKKKEIEEQINLAVLASYGTDGKIDNNLLKENLNKIQGIEKIEDIVYPLTAKVDGYEFKISENGNVTYNGEIKLADETVDSSRGIEPSGTIDITENGEYNVTNYAIANVSVPLNIPSGTKEITTSADNIDVSNYQYADTSSLYTQSDYTDYGTSQYELGYNAGENAYANSKGFKCGTFVQDTIGIITVSCGFKPKYIMIMSVNADGTARANSVLYYNEAISDENSYIVNRTAETNQLLEYPLNDSTVSKFRIYNITNTGFEFKSTSDNGIVNYWVAFK